MAIRIEEELKNDFLVYAKEVNNNRAFPDSRDGLKISQRAALYTMYNHGFTSNKPHVKSAKITGSIIGELHPHGDVGAYQTIVRMSQPWVNNIPEVNFHGANGSLIGGSDAASSRYTECRLAESVEDGFFANIKKDSVDMIPNFSEDMEWPSVFPAIFPRLFVNGSQGIGYTIAQEWEPGNLNEFKNKVEEYIANKKLDCYDIYPDYPTGGVIINKKDIHEIYETGKGLIILRAKTQIVDDHIDITELPYQVYAEPLIQSIKDLVNNETITGIEDICNMSDDKGLLIRIICSSDPQIILNQLYNKTDLQCSFKANQMALVNGIPELLNLEQYVKIYIDFNIECIIREYKYDLAKAEQRLEIVSGLTKALDSIDDIISIIKKSKSSEIAHENLIKSFRFTEHQAKAIVDMKLGKLASLENKELISEEKELNKTITNCNKMLKSKSNQMKEFMSRLTAFTNKYGWERRTQLTDIDIVKEKSIIKAATKIGEEFVIVLDNNHIKKIPIANYKSKNNLNAIKVGAKNKFILVSETGIMYKLQANRFKAGSLNSVGEDLANILNDKIINIFTGNETDEFMFIITKSGLVKKMATSDIFNVSKNIGTKIMKLRDEDEIIHVKLLNKGDNIDITHEDTVVNISVDDYNCRSRAAGGIKF